MPTISGRTALTATGTAGATVTNVLQGSQYEFMPFDGKISIGILATVNLVTCAIFAGPDVLAEPGSMVPINATESAPKYPDEYHWEDEVAMGDRLKIGLVNGNAGAATVNWALRISRN